MPTQPSGEGTLHDRLALCQGLGQLFFEQHFHEEQDSAEGRFAVDLFVELSTANLSTFVNAAPPHQKAQTNQPKDGTTGIQAQQNAWLGSVP